MGRNLILAVLLIMGGSCKKDDVGSLASSCYPTSLTRAYKVNDLPVVVSPSGGLLSGYQLAANNGVFWSACNLPTDFKKDNLKIYVSGYALTSPQLDLMNITPLPFEIVSARLR